MTSAPLVRRIALGVGVSAMVGMGMLTACTAKEKPAETTPPSPPSATAPVSPTEKGVPGAITPGGHSGNGAQNSYAPTVKAKPAPTALPGNINTGG